MASGVITSRPRPRFLQEIITLALIEKAACSSTRQIYSVDLLRVPYSTTVLSELARTSEPRSGCRSWRYAWRRRHLSVSDEGTMPSPRSFKASLAGVAASQFLDASLHNSLLNRTAIMGTANHQGIA